jgi:guanylate kinase
MAADQDVLLEIDWQGAEQVMQLVPDAVSVFILPPSMPELERRLRGRGTDPDDVITRRLAAAGHELAQAPHYDFVIINDDFQTALQGLKSVISSARCRFAQQRARHPAQFSEFGI